jgi:hypothetical protein
MARHPVKATRKQLLKLIDELEKRPTDRVRLLGDVGITAIGAGLGAAAAGTIAGVAGVTSFFGLTTAAGWIGVTVAAATPIGWIAAIATGAGAAAYGVTRLIRGGSMAEGRKLELLQKFREDAKRVEAKERAKSIVDTDRTQFIVSLRELIDKSVLPPEKAFKLIELVEEGTLPLAQAFSHIAVLLGEKAANPMLPTKLS